MKISKEIIEGKETLVIDFEYNELHYKGDPVKFCDKLKDNAMVINAIFVSKNNEAKSEDYPIAEENIEEENDYLCDRECSGKNKCDEQCYICAELGIKL